MKRNLADCFFEKAAAQPHHPLILGQEAENKTSYGEFRDQVQALAKALKEAGVGSGDNLGLLYPSGHDYIAFVYAIWACGASVTPIPAEMTAPEKRQIFQFIHIDAVISSTRFFDQIRDCVAPGAASLTQHAVYARVAATCEAPPELPI